MQFGPESKSGAIAVSVLLLLSGVAAAQVLVFQFDDSLTAEDPLDSRSTITFDFYANQWTNDTVITNANPGSDYLLQINLTRFAGKTGYSAIRTSRQNGSDPEKTSSMCSLRDRGEFISCFYVENTTKNFDEQIRRGLMTDGNASYYNIPANGNGKLKFKVLSTNDGTVEVHRAAYVPDEISVRTHRKVDTDKCGTCHAVKYPPQVHQDMGATREAWVDWDSGRCESCHGDTMTDLHQDCDNACHDDGYPIVANEDDPDEPIEKHDPNNASRPNMIQGEYFCGSSSGCHGSSRSWSDEGDIEMTGGIGSTHVKEFAIEESTGYCIQCHNDVDPGWNSKSITNLHASRDSESGCEDCHGVYFEWVHEPAWNMGMSSKSDCGDDGCHAG